jgi:hypothetical protein
MSKILIKFPTRGRPEKFFNVLDQYINMSNNVNDIAFLVSMDADDAFMNNDTIISKLKSYKDKVKIVYFFGESKTKMQAINADIEKVNGWDILLLASDDMIPIVQGYDEQIRKDMEENFADMDGVLWYNDGGQNNINTLSILGREYYKKFNYIYHPDYISLWCDNEFTDVSIKLNKVYRSDKVIIEHQHPAWQKTNYDELYMRNESYYGIDQQTYERRSALNFNLPKKNVITFCVYGTHPMYSVGALKNAQLALKLYPDWICRFYVFKECEHLIPEIKKFPNTEVVFCNKKGSHYSMLYRFLPFGEKDVNYFMSRDTDSRLSYREKEAVDEWLSSGKSFHIMKDHPVYHRTPEYPLLGGMFGAKGGIVFDIQQRILNYISSNMDMHGMDQYFLQSIYNDFAKNDNLTHDCDFPSPRNVERDGIWFIGQPIDENDNFFGPADHYIETLNG